jgi:hypothetical protein
MLLALLAMLSGDVSAVESWASDEFASPTLSAVTGGATLDAPKIAESAFAR